MTLTDVFEHFGNQAKTAQALGINRASVTEWVKNGRVPMQRQWQIELLTDGKLTADQPAKVA